MGQCNCKVEINIDNRICVNEKSIIAEYWRPLLSLAMILLGSGINAMNVQLFQNEYISLVWYILAYIPVGLPVHG